MKSERIDQKQLDSDMTRVAEAYEAGDYDRYEVLIERYARKYKIDEGLFEDWCTDHRLFGAGCCG